MKPRFDIFRALYARIAAKPEGAVELDWFRHKTLDCGTSACVLGELAQMPEGRALGFTWAIDDYGNDIVMHGGSQFSSMEGDGRFLGLTKWEQIRMFDAQVREDIPEKQEALERLEALFLAHAEPLHLPDSIEYARRDEVVA